jgi:hypothetical protein
VSESLTRENLHKWPKKCALWTLINLSWQMFREYDLLWLGFIVLQRIPIRLYKIFGWNFVVSKMFVYSFKARIRIRIQPKKVLIWTRKGWIWPDPDLQHCLVCSLSIAPILMGSISTVRDQIQIISLFAVRCFDIPTSAILYSTKKCLLPNFFRVLMAFFLWTDNFFRIFFGTFCKSFW